MATDSYKKMEQGARRDTEAEFVRQAPNVERLHAEEAEAHELPRDGRRYDGRDVRRLKEAVGEDE